MRIVLNPPQMRTAATALDDAAEAYNVTSQQLSQAPLPVMPPAIAAHVNSVVAGAASTLRASAEKTHASATELRVRSIAAELGVSLRFLLNGAVRGFAGSDQGFLKRLDQAMTSSRANDLRFLDAMRGLSTDGGTVVAGLVNRAILRDVDALGMARLAGGDQSAATLARWLALRQRLSVFAPGQDARLAEELLAGGDRTANALKGIDGSVKSLFMGGEKIAPFMEGLGKVVTPVAALDSIYTLVGPSDASRSEGWNAINRGMAGLTLIGLAGGPEAAPLLLVAGGWQIGNWVVDNHQAIADAAVTVSKDIWHGVVQVGQTDLQVAGAVVGGAEQVVGGAISWGQKNVGDVLHNINPLNW